MPNSCECNRAETLYAFTLCLHARCLVFCFRLYGDPRLVRTMPPLLAILLLVSLFTENQADCDHFYREWLAKLGNDTFTEPARIKRILPLMVGTMDRTEPVLNPVLDLLEEPFNWSSYFDSSLRCASAFPEANDVMCLIGDVNTTVVDVAPFVRDVLHFSVLLERFTAAAVKSARYNRIWDGRMRKMKKRTRSWFAFFKWLAVARGMSLISNIREHGTERGLINRLRGPRMNLVFYLNIFGGTLADRHCAHCQNRMVGQSLLRIRDIFDNRLYSRKGEFVDRYP